MLGSQVGICPGTGWIEAKGAVGDVEQPNETQDVVGMDVGLTGMGLLHG